MATEALRFYTARVVGARPGHAAGAEGRLDVRDGAVSAVASPQQSKELTASRQPAIVISSSGMATGGRVLHHMAAALPDPRNTVLFVGYQAAGTRGRLLVDGAREVKIHGRHVPVAARIAKIDSMSAHADRGEIVRWLATLPQAPAASAWCTARPVRWTRCRRSSRIASGGKPYHAGARRTDRRVTSRAGVPPHAEANAVTARRSAELRGRRARRSST